MCHTSNRLTYMAIYTHVLMCHTHNVLPIMHYIYTGYLDYKGKSV